MRWRQKGPGERNAATRGHSGKASSVIQLRDTPAQISNACWLEDHLGEGSPWLSAPPSITGILALLLQGALQTQTPRKPG